MPDLVPQPENLGLMNRNESCVRHVCVQRLADKGLEFAVRCRSDNIPSWFVSPGNQRTLLADRNAGRPRFSLRFLAVHAVPLRRMRRIARTEDMLALWSLPEDPRPAGSGPPTSCPIGWNRRRSGITRSVPGTLSNLCSLARLCPASGLSCGVPWPALPFYRRASWPLSRII